jgi:RimJ/RimL family protein N-acetyltransferase
VTIRLEPARLDDAMAYRGIRLDALMHAPDAFGTQYSEVADKPLSFWVHAIERMDILMLARDGGDVIGTASGGPYVEPGVTSTGLYGMYVTESHRGTGVAAELVSAIADWAFALGSREIYLQVTEGNVAAERLYRRMGFQLTSRRVPMARDATLILREMVASLPLEVA